MSDLSELRDVEHADVYKQGVLAAILHRTSEGVQFSYLREWIDAAGPAIATSLPVSEIPVRRPGGALPAFFTGLLPEGRRLGALRREIKTSTDDELSLLLGVGADAIGDVQVVPAGVALAEIPPRVEIDRDFSDVLFADLLAELGIRAERIGLPGVQDKVSAAVLNLPVARRGARFILKLNPPEFPHLVENEACFLQAAQRSGLAAAKARVVTDAAGASGLLVERFDRVPQGPGHPPQAKAMEDACQVLGVPPGDKYRVGAERALTALAAACQAPQAAARTLLSQLVFAYLSANGDAHAKNFSILQEATGEWLPSPAYDLPSSHPYGDTTMALSIGGRTSGDFGGKDFLALGAVLNLPERAVRKVLTEQASRVDAWLPLLTELPLDPGKVHKLVRVVKYRRDRLLQ